jgi:3-hydroxymyristoyl/3-hydroxydecanoyl-(acyl carrier protein) dehydratase
MWLELQNLLAAGHAGRKVANAPDQLHPAFAHESLRLAAGLAQQRVRRVALWFEDAGLLAQALLACWRADVVALLPGDVRPLTCSALDAGVDLWISDTALPLPAARQQQAAQLARQPALAPAELDPDAGGLILCTSGSSGAPKRIAKSWRQMQAEIDALQAAWPTLPMPAAVLGSVSPQHMYGLPFRVLWPLCAGRAIDREQRAYPEDIQDATVAHAQALWIASPALLKRLGDDLRWSELSGKVAAIFSSGGPLPAETAEAIARHGLPRPIEIYGSSETGAVAWRQHEPAWRLLPGVLAGVGVDEASIDDAAVRPQDTGILHVQSPWTAAQARETTQDRVRIAAQGFLLLGRNDRIVKIEEKRIALPQVEHWLARHAYVAEARVGQADGQRRLSALVALSGAGLLALRANGRRELVQVLQKHMADGVDTLAIPRRWRLMQALPYNTQGKLTQEIFDRAAGPRPFMPQAAGRPEYPDAVDGAPFTPQAHPAPPPSEPAHPPLPLPQTERGCRVQLLVPPDLAHFSGHFPRAPVVPGVVQIDWALALAREYLGISLQFAGIENLKFQRLLRPGDAFAAHLRWEPARTRLHFDFRSGTDAVASGRILHGAPLS